MENLKTPRDFIDFYKKFDALQSNDKLKEEKLKELDEKLVEKCIIDNNLGYEYYIANRPRHIARAICATFGIPANNKLMEENKRLREALEDIAGGPLQNSDFSTYCAQKAKQTLAKGEAK